MSVGSVKVKNNVFPFGNHKKLVFIEYMGIVDRRKKVRIFDNNVLVSIRKQILE